MNTEKLMNTIKQWDNKTSQWFFRHFYLMFFQIILVGVFIAFFINTINTISISAEVSNSSVIEHLLMTQNNTQLLMLFLMILNSFWTLILLTSIFRIRTVLKNIDFSLSRRSGGQTRNRDL